MKNNYTIVNYKNKEYIVAKTNKDDIFVIDNEKISNLSNVNYYLNNCGYVYGKKVYLLLLFFCLIMSSYFKYSLYS